MTRTPSRRAQKMRAGSSISRSVLTVAASTMLGSIRMPRYSMSWCGWLRSTVSMRSALRWKRRASMAISRAIVAENSRVPALGRRRIQDELQLVPEAEVEHLVGLIEHDDAQGGGIELPALQMVLEPPRSADDDVRAARQGAGFAAGIHPADARDDSAAGFAVEPGQLAMHLLREFARRRDDQRERRAGVGQIGCAGEQGVGRRRGRIRPSCRNRFERRPKDHDPARPRESPPEQRWVLHSRACRAPAPRRVEVSEMA